MTEHSLQDNNSLSILVVDDSPSNLDLIYEYVEGEGFDIICAERALGALQYLEECEESEDKNVDVILLDKMMPHMNGIELVKKLKNDERFENIPVIMISASTGQKSIKEGMEVGVFAYLTKPLQRENLIKTIKLCCKIKK